MADTKKDTAPKNVFETALLESEYGFTQDDLDAIAVLEIDRGSVENWSRPAFDEALGALKGRAAYEVVASVKVGDATEQKKAVLPERAPYLTYNAKGEPLDYSPHDPAQFYTDEVTGEMYRWDGKGAVHRVVKVDHRRYGDTFLPDEESALAAINSGHQWFHRGLNVWIAGAKELADPDQEDRDKVRMAMMLRDRQTENDGSRPFSNVRLMTPAMAG